MLLTTYKEELLKEIEMLKEDIALKEKEQEELPPFMRRQRDNIGRKLTRLNYTIANKYVELGKLTSEVEKVES